MAIAVRCKRSHGRSLTDQGFDFTILCHTGPVRVIVAHLWPPDRVFCSIVSFVFFPTKHVAWVKGDELPVKRTAQPLLCFAQPCCMFARLLCYHVHGVV